MPGGKFLVILPQCIANIVNFNHIISNQGVCGGILRGSGRQHIGAVIVFVGYAIGLPVGIYLMFKTSLKVSGRSTYGY